MIWHFSGSGNSQHVANKLAEGAGCKAASIERAGNTRPAPDGVWGLVFPVYCCGLPEIVVRFLRDEANLPAPGDYVVLAATCGVSSGMALRQAAGLLAEHGISVDASFAFRMADNDASLYDIDLAAASAANDAAEPAIDEAAELVAQRASVPCTEDDPLEAAQERYRFYDEKRRC